LKEDSKYYFSLLVESPYMLLTAKIKEERLAKIPENYYEIPLSERLYIRRSDIPAVTHIDFSARIQTVDRQTNLRFWELLHAYKNHTGIGLLINTSFNVRGEPIVCTPEDAYRCFMRTEMDFLVLDNFLLNKADQTAWISTENRAVDLILD
jgi:carbamoyltransferase